MTAYPPAFDATVRGISILLTIDDVAQIYRQSPSTIRSQVQRGTFRPQPFLKYPYRWRKADIDRDIASGKHDLKYNKHGFAAKKLVPARARLRPKKASGEETMSYAVMKLVEQAALPRREKTVGRHLAAALADDAGRSVYPRVRTLAARSGYSERSVVRALGELQAQGVIARVRNPRPHRATEYRFNLAALAALGPAFAQPDPHKASAKQRFPQFAQAYTGQIGARTHANLSPDPLNRSLLLLNVHARARDKGKRPKTRTGS